MMHIRVGTLVFVLCVCLAGQTVPSVMRNVAVTVNGEGEEPSIHVRNAARIRD